jgi:hypothetical protein
MKTTLPLIVILLCQTAAHVALADNRDLDSQTLAAIPRGTTIQLKLSGEANQSHFLGDYLITMFSVSRPGVPETLALTEKVGKGALQCAFYVGERKDAHAVTFEGSDYSMTVGQDQSFVNGPSAEKYNTYTASFDPNLEDRSLAEQEVACLFGCTVTDDLYVRAVGYEIFAKQISIDGKKVDHLPGNHIAWYCEGDGIDPTIADLRTLLENNGGSLDIPQVASTAEVVH